MEGSPRHPGPGQGSPASLEIWAIYSTQWPLLGLASLPSLPWCESGPRPLSPSCSLAYWPPISLYLSLSSSGIFYNANLICHSNASAVAFQGLQDKVYALQPGPQGLNRYLRLGSQEADFEMEVGR